MVTITKNGTDPQKMAILIDGGIHAREWISPAVVVYLIDQFTNNPNNDPMIEELLAKFDWYFIPVVNPDGYLYSMSAPERRFWRKNRRKTSLDPECFGVDLNRNFDFPWNPDIGGSREPCNHEIYAGPYAFSEKESSPLSNVMAEISRKSNLVSYLSFHNNYQAWLYPWNFHKGLLPDFQDLIEAAAVATGNMVFIKEVIQGGSVYEAAGTSSDYAKEGNIKYSYTVELPLKENGPFVDARLILPISRDVLNGIKAFANFIYKKLKS